MHGMRALVAGMVLAGLSGCASIGQPEAPPTIFDIAPQDVAPIAVRVPMADLEVFAPSWLSSSAMQYRLEPVSALERRFYATNRWAGMPAEMMEVVFKRVIQTQPADNGSGCRLRIDLDEFIQRFASAEQSAGLIELRASVLAPRTDVLIAYKTFLVEVPAPSADAAGGVVALRGGVNQLAVELAQWLTGLERGDSARLNVGERCSN
ncbi:MAG: membrane integrity-associated transporter subunit PqiC [Rhodocyclaceae bacterium]|nr:membrane integrity-associated transporter subunit PqiC [Rhodocyclaceae bacterium]